jgi:hypothetical protein
VLWAAPHQAVASPVLITLQFLEEFCTCISFDATSLRIDLPLQYRPIGPDASGNAVLEAGPLLGFEPIFIGGIHERTRYQYGPGQITLNLSWLTPGGTPLNGSFLGTVSGVEFVVYEEDAPPGIGDEYPFFSAYWTLGPGVFTPSLANYLGVSRHTAGGEFTTTVDEAEGPAGGARTGYLNGPELTIVAKVVPEPAVFALLAVSLPWLARRRLKRMTRAPIANTSQANDALPLARIS